MSKFDINNFPITTAAISGHPKLFQRFLDGLTLLESSLEAKQIRNVELSELKSNLGRAVDIVFETSVIKPFVWNCSYKKNSVEEEAAMNIRPYNVHELSAAKKKSDKIKESTPFITALKNTISELYVLNEALNELKPLVVKGRAPSSKPAAPVNPNKDVKTCPCCFRAIAVVGSTMAHHGFRRTGHGWQTASCPGIRFKPLEISNEGLKYVLGLTQESLRMTKENIKNLPSATSLTRGTGRNATSITPASPLWRDVYRAHEYQLTSSLNSLQREERNLSNMLAEWQPQAVSKSRKAEVDSEGPQI